MLFLINKTVFLFPFLLSVRYNWKSPGLGARKPRFSISIQHLLHHLSLVRLGFLICNRRCLGFTCTSNEWMYFVNCTILLRSSVILLLIEAEKLYKYMSTEYRPLVSTENLNLAYEKVNLFLSLWCRNTWLLVGVRWGSGGVRDWWKVEPDIQKHNTLPSWKKKHHVSSSKHFEQLFDI